MHLTRPVVAGRRVAIATLSGYLTFLALCATAFATSTIGIYDDPAGTRSFGTMDSNPKFVYLVVRLDGSAGEGYTGLECSIAGLEAFAGHLLFWHTPPQVVIGSFRVDPATGLGGLNVAWGTCQNDDHEVVQLALFAPTPPENLILRVEMRHPPTNPSFTYPLGVECDAPCFGCHWRFESIPYVLNPTVGVALTTWGAIKSLY